MSAVEAFVLANTRAMAPPLVPEVRLRLALESIPIWQKTEAEMGELGLPPPFWAFAWAGGQALARHVLDHPEIVAGKSVLDLATGSGLVAIAAARAGAVLVLAADIDDFAVAAAAVNARANAVVLTITGENLLKAEPPPVDVILVGDLFYEKQLAAEVFAWLETAQQRGAVVWIGDPGRSYLPKDRLVRQADYLVPVSRELEDSDVKLTSVWMLRNC